MFFDLLLYLFIAALLGLGFAAGFYLLCTSNRRIFQQYQNRMLGWTKRPLKDEDFRHAAQKIFLVKPVGAGLVFLSLCGSWFVLFGGN